MDAFMAADAIVAGTEAGYVNNPDDPGGETKYGISKRAYPTVDIANLTIEQAQAIRRRDYWDAISGDALPPPIALLVYDAAVNNGVASAKRWLQLAAGVEADDVIGPATLAAVTAADGRRLSAEFQAYRTDFMARLPTWKIFGLGWARRLCALPYKALTMTGSSS